MKLILKLLLQLLLLLHVLLLQLLGLLLGLLQGLLRKLLNLPLRLLQRKWWWTIKILSVSHTRSENEGQNNKELLHLNKFL